MILLDIHYTPIPWKAPRFSRWGTYDVQADKKSDIKKLILSQYQGEILTCPVSIEFIFYFTPPKSLSKKKYQAYVQNLIPILNTTDCTNCQKLFEDTLQGTVIKNDKQVQKISSQKLYSTKAHVVCKIEKLFENQS